MGEPLDGQPRDQLMSGERKSGSETTPYKELNVPDLVHHRTVTPEQFAKFEGYVAEIFEAFGMRMNAPGTRATPRRFLRALFDATEGYEGDPKLITTFPTECRGGTACKIDQVVEGPIVFYSFCEHHGFPFFGRAYVGYIAHEHIIGLSKLTRLVRVWARRFSVQERLTVQIADTLEYLLQPHGIAVYLEAHHMCMQMRGVRASEPMTRTNVWRGEYAENAGLRHDFLEMVGQRHSIF